MPSEISVVDTKALIDSSEEVVLIDCREPLEFELCRIDGAKLIPMASIPDRCEELDQYKEQRIVVYCHLGIRSLQVVNWLRNHGYSRTQNMTGGIDAWSVQIDPTVARY